MRKNSYNRKLINDAVSLYGIVEYEEHSLTLPLYNGDLEEDGCPEIVETLPAKLKSAADVIIVFTEYNKWPSGVLKNAFDCISRVLGGVWKDKPVAVMTSASGRTGGETADQIDHNRRLTSEQYITSVTSLMASLRTEIALKTA